MTDSRHPLSPPPAPEAAPNAYGDVRRLLPQLPGRTAALLLTGLVGACSVPGAPGEVAQPGSGEPIAVPEGLPEPEPGMGSGVGSQPGEGSQGPGAEGSAAGASGVHDPEGSGVSGSPEVGDAALQHAAGHPVKPDEVRQREPVPVYGLPPGPPPPQPPPVQPYGVPVPPPEPPLVPTPIEPGGGPGGGLGDLPPLEGSGVDAGTMLPSTGAYGAPPALRSPRP
ncbi:MAG: hypothetical protein KGO50_07140 [Myxococcales bacterium]|nr:hypothetical protein [Myxococcales bacterium]